MRRIGRHSLEVFCLGVVLAPLADVANTVAGDGVLIQVTTGLAGVVIMIGFARLIEWSRGLKRPAAANPGGRPRAPAVPDKVPAAPAGGV